MRLKTIRWILWGITGAVSLSLAFAILWRDDRFGTEPSRETDAFRADFELTDHQGMVRTDEDFAGRWLLVFFGFANCPDICPTTLAEVAAVMDELGESGAPRVQPLFISVDPERDTPAALAEFVPRFEAGIVGLTGTSAQISATARSFYIYYEKIEEAAALDGYSMSHSSQLFLFGPDGAYVTAYAYGTPAEEILADLNERLES
ncbi:SCO family protein [Sedimentitalea sp. XS_ASV28]|uniref:SCO family protein n=1 Tax=Sedimentitalea sp. XS_ASV28 TaxID=3241296 RepID=UPI0035126001